MTHREPTTTIPTHLAAEAIVAITLIAGMAVYWPVIAKLIAE